MTRREVLALIDGERDYQDQLPPSRTDGAPRSVGDYLTMLRRYMALADAAWVDNPGDTQALDVVRKLAGIGVHCLEDHTGRTRTQIYAGIHDRWTDPSYTVGEYLTFIHGYLVQDFVNVSNIVSACVRCMENHGAPARRINV